MQKIVPMLGIMSLILAGCSQSTDIPVANAQESVAETTADKPLDTIEVKEVSDKNEALFNLGKAVVLQEDSKNIMVSPLSIERCFALAIEGANGETKDQLVKAIYSNLDFDKASSEISEACTELQRYGSYESNDGGLDVLSKKKSAFNIANSLWVNSDADKFGLKPDYKKTVADKYKAKAESISFKEGPEPINSWVDKNTDGMIPSVLDKLNDTSRVVLVNATMFTGGWRDKFNKLDGKNEFTNADGYVQNVDFMESYKDDKYVQIKGRDAFVKNYNNGFSFIGILPNKGETAEELLKDLEFKDISEIKDTNYELILDFPKYNYDYDTSLINVFKRLGVNDAFNDKADFSNMSDDPLYISDAIHKTHIEVDEDGTKAAAVTSITMDLNCALDTETPPVKELTFDRPFVYLIVADDIPVFMGIVNDIET
jgi:serpin B